MSDKDLQQENRGIWIPSEVWENPNLSIQEKALLARVYSFKECFASNQYLADFLGLSVTRTKEIITSLVRSGYLFRSEERKGNLTVKRILSVNKSKYFGVNEHGTESRPTPAGKQAHPQPESRHHSNTELEIQVSNSIAPSTDGACKVDWDSSPEATHYSVGQELFLVDTESGDTQWIVLNGDKVEHAPYGWEGFEPIIQRPSQPPANPDYKPMNQPEGISGAKHGRAAKPEKPKRKTKAEKLFDKIRSSGYLMAQASDDVLIEWCKLRARKGASDSDLVHNRIDGQLQILINHGMTIDAALTEQVARNWTDLKAEWFDFMKGRLPNQQDWSQQTQPGWSAGLENEIYRGGK